jgi:hypothetical protein
MKITNSIRFTIAFMSLMLILMSSISCKKEAAVSQMVGKWLIYAAADDDNGNSKVDDSEWKLLTKDDYDALLFFGITGEAIFNADGTGNLVTTDKSQNLTLKWRVKSDGNFEIYDNVISINGTTQTGSNDSAKIYFDAKGEMITEDATTTTVFGVTTTTLSFGKYKKI